MPTLAPPKVLKPTTDEERIKRKQLTALIKLFIGNLQNCLYNYRSHQPCKFDHTTISTELENVAKVCRARPDWVVKCFDPVYGDIEKAGVGLNGLVEEIDMMNVRLNLKGHEIKQLKGTVKELRERLKALMDDFDRRDKERDGVHKYLNGIIDKKDREIASLKGKH